MPQGFFAKRACQKLPCPASFVAMSTRIGLIVLALLAIGLTVGLVVVRKQAIQSERESADRIGALSNNLVQASTSLEQQRTKTTQFEEDLEKSRQAFAEVSNNLTQVSANLAQANSSLAKTEASLKATEEEVKRRDSRITELTGQNEALDKQAADLTVSLTNLTVQIVETQRKLMASEGDKAFLQKELKRLMAEKAELERQFNDLAVLRAQVTRLREELSIARRIEWIRQGFFSGSDVKGGARLMQGITPALGRTRTPPPPDLEVEVQRDPTAPVVTTNRVPSSAGSSSETNAPANQ